MSNTAADSFTNSTVVQKVIEFERLPQKNIVKTAIKIFPKKFKFIDLFAGIGGGIQPLLI